MDLLSFNLRKLQDIEDVTHYFTDTKNAVEPENYGRIWKHESHGPYRLIKASVISLVASNWNYNAVLSDGTILFTNNNTKNIFGIHKFKIKIPNRVKENPNVNNFESSVQPEIYITTDMFRRATGIQVDAEDNVFLISVEYFIKFNKNREQVFVVALAYHHSHILRVINENKHIYESQCNAFELATRPSNQIAKTPSTRHEWTLKTITMRKSGFSAFVVQDGTIYLGQEDRYFKRIKETSHKNFVTEEVQLQHSVLKRKSSKLKYLVQIPKSNSIICLFEEYVKDVQNHLLEIYTENGDCLYSMEFVSLSISDLLPVNKHEIYMIGSRFVYCLMSLSKLKQQ